MEKSLALAEAAQTGDTAALYALLRQNPYLLEDIDKIPFVDTPLHTAAAAGCTHFAIEILSLKPSFAKKLNPDGYSPIDLALTSRQIQTVKQLIRYDPELIRVKRKERFTPLHYAVEMDDADLLAEFLVSCPKSIEDLTVREETAVHIAVRNRKMRAFKVLLGWLSEADLEQILNWQDEKGNTVLHIATSTNNLEAVNLIMKRRKINSYKKNVEGLTALDIARGLPNAEENKSLARRLRGLVTRRFSGSNENENLAARFILISEASLLRKYLMTLLSSLKEFSGDITASDETRQALLVVLVLIATATYQAMLSPPDALKRKRDQADNINLLHVFLVLNSETFLLSIYWMWCLFKTGESGSWMRISLMYLVSGYVVVMLSYFPVAGSLVVAAVVIALFFILISIKSMLIVSNVHTSS